MQKTLGKVAAAAATGLLAILGIYAFTTDNPVDPRFIFLVFLDLPLWLIAVRLLGDAHAMAQLEDHTSAHVQGVRETVDRLASVLKDAPR